MLRNNSFAIARFDRPSASPMEVELATVYEGPSRSRRLRTTSASALPNVHKHAGASWVVVHASTGEYRLVVESEDDGIGGANVDGEGLRRRRSG